MVGIKRGDIWLVNFNPTRGSEQRGIRPALVVSNDVTNRHSPTICVAPLTSNLAGLRFPINVLIESEESGMKMDSAVLCGQIRTMAKERLIRKLSKLSCQKLRMLCRSTWVLKIVLGIPTPKAICHNCLLE